MLGGYMAGVTVSGVLWAIFQNNAGGAWDNAKKSFEAGVEINGEMTYKGSEAHKAAVTGDTVGDPFKDTSGPSMNILIKLTCLIGLVIAPILGDGHVSDEVSAVNKSEIKKCSSEGKKACCAKTENKNLVVNAGIIQPSTNSNVISVSTNKGGETISDNEIGTPSGEIIVEPIDKSEKSSL
jgi:K(+)-stimulated pyrophosphate-energized sodium pump